MAESAQADLLTTLSNQAKSLVDCTNKVGYCSFARQALLTGTECQEENQVAAGNDMVSVWIERL
jgi:hypothetical protein